MEEVLTGSLRTSEEGQVSSSIGNEEKGRYRKTEYKEALGIPS